MKKTFVLTSFVALGFAIPAMADNNSNYTENSQYGETCSVGNIGAYDSSTGIATAHFAPDTYQCTAGQYLGADSTACGACPAGSFCSSADTYTFNASAAQGATACPTGYTNSDSGASANTQCYRTCTNNDAAHSTGTVNGGVYYDGTSGDGVNACVPTDCVSGWHLQSTPDLATIIGVTEAGTEYGYQNDSAASPGGYNQSTYGITHNNEFVTNYGAKGKIHGYARCSNVEGTNNNEAYTNPTILTNAQIGADGTGGYCYCQLDGYTPNGQSMQSISAPWVFKYDFSDAGECAGECANACSSIFLYASTSGLAYRAAVFNSVVQSAPSCVANTITVRWGDKDGGVHDSTQCTYGGTLYTPTTAPAAPKGHHFTGWTFDLGNN